MVDIWIVLIFIQSTSELVISIYLSGYENRLEKKLAVKKDREGYVSNGSVGDVCQVLY
jgi:hypothetical protein